MATVRVFSVYLESGRIRLVQSFFVSRIALPGATPFGHAFTQFMTRSQSGAPVGCVAAFAYRLGFVVRVSS